MYHPRTLRIVLQALIVSLSFLLVQKAAALQLPNFTELAEKNSPAVVNISTTTKREPHPSDKRKQFQIPDIPEDSPFYEFFERFLGEGISPEQLQPQTSLGSGFILSKDGYIITNFHVVKDADEVIVRLRDRREFKAKVIGTDSRSDIAVLKVKADNLPEVRIGKSSDLKVGEWVLAIGSPFGFDYSVTAGIVSAKGRSLPSENYVPFIQTDVAINPGNSGGPLFNLQGEVVGVNSQIFSRTGGFMGLSFAIPIDDVMNVYQQLKDTGSVTRGWLGVLIQDVTRELAESFSMEKPHGALVAKVLPDSPALAAGMQPGDVVIKFDNKTINLSADLPPMVGSSKVGRQYPVEVIRSGNPKTLRVTIGKLPKDDKLWSAADDKPHSKSDNRLNIVATDPTDQQRKELEIGDHGVIVEKIEKGPARIAGIMEGDVILQINNKKVKDVKFMKALIAKLPVGKSVPVLIQRRGGPIFLALKIKDSDD